jgi:hypothetical protein
MKAIPILHLFLSVFERGGGRERERERKVRWIKHIKEMIFLDKISVYFCTSNKKG